MTFNDTQTQPAADPVPGSKWRHNADGRIVTIEHADHVGVSYRYDDRGDSCWRHPASFAKRFTRIDTPAQPAPRRPVVGDVVEVEHGGRWRRLAVECDHGHAFSGAGQGDRFRGWYRYDSSRWRWPAPESAATVDVTASGGASAGTMRVEVVPEPPAPPPPDPHAKCTPAKWCGLKVCPVSAYLAADARHRMVMDATSDPGDPICVPPWDRYERPRLGPPPLSLTGAGGLACGLIGVRHRRAKR